MKLTVFEDDTTIIPRSTTVIAKRLPAARPGKGGAARYVSGKMPIHAKNSHRSEAGKAGAKATTDPSVVPNIEAQSEEERMAAILKMGSEQWSQQKQEMAR
jgi:protein MPE1